MNNLFNSENYPTTEPAELVSGARWAWTRPDITSVYPTDTYTLKYKLANQDGTRSIEFTAAKVSSAHVVEIPTATSAAYISGDYLWKALIVRDSDSEEVLIDEGYLVLKPQSGNVGSHVYKTLMAIRATIEGKASKDQLTYSINGRSLTRYSFNELNKLEAEYSRRFKREQDAIDQKNGRIGKNKVLTKLGA